MTDSPHKDRFSSSAYVRRTNDQDIERRIRARHEYRHAGPAKKNASFALRVLEVEPGSLASRVGLGPGDEIVAVNGEPLLDVIDFQFRVASFGEPVSITTRGATIEFVREEYEGLGAEFEPIEPLVCDNDCVFCFVHQNPSHVRRSLRIKDEDYRLSFLFGNYLTLTNVGEAELTRIIEQRLSPLYISVHATDHRLRARMLGNEVYDGLDTKLDRLSGAGIELHCQVVLCPGWTDGAHLARTISDLARRHPGIRSVAVVPVGLTDHRGDLPVIEAVTPVYARETIRRVEPIQQRFLETWGTPFVFLGDEFYILADEPIPGADHYQEFPLIENGVGMVRSFLDDFEEELRSFDPSAIAGVCATVATGQLFYPYLDRCVRRLGVNLEAVPVPSRFWGCGINVAGLLTGSDFIAALDGIARDVVLVPSEAVIGDEGLFLDDMNLGDVERALGVPVVRAGYSAAEFLEVLARLS